MLVLIRPTGNHQFMAQHMSFTTQNSATQQLSCCMPYNVGAAERYSVVSITTYHSPRCQSHGGKFKLPLRESLMDEHHAEVLGKIVSQKMPLETPVEQPDLGILSLQAGFTLAFIQIHKTHLTRDLYCNKHNFR
jgi:hypothetical protein